MMLEHGGRLNAAVKRWGFSSAMAGFIHRHQPGQLACARDTARSWQRLPEADDGLNEIIRQAMQHRQRRLRTCGR